MGHKRCLIHLHIPSTYSTKVPCTYSKSQLSLYKMRIITSSLQDYSDRDPACIKPDYDVIYIIIIISQIYSLSN